MYNIKMNLYPFILSNITQKTNSILLITLIVSVILLSFFGSLIFINTIATLTLLLSIICILIFIDILIQFKKIRIIKRSGINESKLNEALLNAISHELRTPISVIIGAIDNLLLEDPSIAISDKNKLLTEISIASLRLNRQVENLLNTSRIQSGFLQLKKDWCDINELIQDVIGQLNDQLKDHIVNLSIKTDLPLFKLDRDLMEQVIYNLVNNAAIHTPARSLITITVDQINKELLLIVEDNGRGIPENETDKVFNKFYRINNSIAGTGLGLSIAKGFTEAHGGNIVVEKSALGGAKFIIKIPAKTILLKTTA
jgi:two-component system, OmpR family, sensor histidine kinase KdpD